MTAHSPSELTRAQQDILRYLDVADLVIDLSEGLVMFWESKYPGLMADKQKEESA